MARLRKNAVKKQDALLLLQEVPEIPLEEQPYPLPKGWKWVKGHTFLGPQETGKPNGDFFYYIDIDAIDNKNQKVKSPKKIPAAKAPSRASRKLHEGDTIFSLVRPYLRNIAYINPDLCDCIASTGFYICKPSECIDSRYLFWMMTSDYVVMGLNQYMKGDNSPSIRKDDIENFLFPLPPLREQQRIVHHIESLFAKLDEAKQHAEAVLDRFETRKAAILHKAFTGVLTDSRPQKEDILSKDHSITQNAQPSPLPQGWKWELLGDVLHLKSGKNIKAKEIHQEKSEQFPYPCYGGNGIRGYVAEYNKNGNHYIIGRQGALCGNIHKATGKFYATEHAVVVQLKSNMDIDYAGKYLEFMNLNQYATATAQPGLAVGNIIKLPFLVPPLYEQSRIVNILEALISKEEQAKEAAENVLEQIELMKKSILARAFRGELG